MTLLFDLYYLTTVIKDANCTVYFIPRNKTRYLISNAMEEIIHYVPKQSIF